jgi:hypothetical protein
MVDPSGGTSYASLADDLVCGFSATPNNLGITLAQFYAFPLCIKAGSSLGIQARNASASSLSAGRCAVWLYGRPSRPDSWWCGTKVESLGVVPATSKGANHTPGNGAWSAFGTIGTSTYRYRAVQFGFNGTDSVALAINTHWEIGHGSTRLPGAPRFHTSMSTSETATRHGFGVPIFCDVAASTTWQCRGWGSGAGEVNTVALYGVY